MHQLIKYMLGPDAERRPNIYQVCEVAFKLAGEGNPVQKLHKGKAPLSDQLPVPSFESETKRSSVAASAKARPQPASVMESGTSVAPRQRPKGTAAHVHHPLPLGLPPSPSPRNTISSPRPVAEQFQANFPAIPTPPMQQPAPFVTVANATAATAITPNASVTPTNSNSSKSNLDNLFERNYPGPFSEAGSNSITNTVKTEDQPFDQMTEETIFDAEFG